MELGAARVGYWKTHSQRERERESVVCVYYQYMKNALAQRIRNREYILKSIDQGAECKVAAFHIVMCNV